MRLIRTCRTRVGAVPVLPLGHCSGDLRLITPLPRERVYQRQPATEESKVLRQPPECQIASLPNTTNAAANHGLKIGAGHLLRLTFLSLLLGSTADSPLTKKSTAVTVAFEPSELLGLIDEPDLSRTWRAENRRNDLAREDLVRGTYPHHSDELHVKCVFLHGCRVRAAAGWLSFGHRIQGTATPCSRAGQKTATDDHSCAAVSLQMQIPT